MLNNKIKEIILIILIMIVMLPNYVSAVTINLGNNPPAGKCDAYMIGTILFGLICVLIVDRLWLEHGKDNKAPETIEKHLHRFSKQYDNRGKAYCELYSKGKYKK